jgi:hypothetical protein
MESMLIVYLVILLVFHTDAQSHDTTYSGPTTGSFQNCTSSIPPIPTNDLDPEPDDTGYIIISCNLIKYRVPNSSLDNLKEESILIGVLSGAAVKERRTWIRSTWAYNKRNVFFIVAGDFDSISDEYKKYQDLIWIDKEEVYVTETSTLTFKTEAFLSIMYEKVMTIEGSKVKYLFKTDDDSYCDYNKLHKAFSEELNGVDYWGKCATERKPNRNQDIPWQRKWFISYETYPEPEYPTYCAGAGYALSRKFLDCAIGEGHVAHIRYQPNEDVAVGSLGERCKVHALDDDRVSIRWEGRPTMKNKIIQHYVKDENAMREHHRLITGVYGPKLL